MLATGGEIQGELVNKDEIPRQQYVIKTALGGQVTLARAQVVKVVRESPAQAEYEKIRPSYPDTVEGQWELAEWCRAHRLLAARKTHLERIIELSPDHAQARRVLGYSLMEGRWVTQEQIMTERGYRFYKGQWRLPQEIEIMEDKRKAELAEKEWFQKFKRWRAWLDSEKSFKAVEEISSVDDPAALPALADGATSDPNEAVRLLYIEAIARIGTPGAMDVLVGRSLEDRSEEVRLTSLDLLSEHKHPDIVGRYVKALRHKDNIMVNRAALGLARMEDPSAIAPLIDSLITIHKFAITSGSPGTSSSFGTGASSGGGGISMGQSTKIVKQQIQNAVVRDALVHLTGVNYNYDVRTWKNWYAAQKKDGGLNARRD